MFVFDPFVAIITILNLVCHSSFDCFQHQGLAQILVLCLFFPKKYIFFSDFFHFMFSDFLAKFGEYFHQLLHSMLLLWWASCRKLCVKYAHPFVKKNYLHEQLLDVGFFFFDSATSGSLFPPSPPPQCRPVCPPPPPWPENTQCGVSYVRLAAHFTSKSELQLNKRNQRPHISDPISGLLAVFNKYFFKPYVEGGRGVLFSPRLSAEIEIWWLDETTDTKPADCKHIDFICSV